MSSYNWKKRELNSSYQLLRQIKGKNLQVLTRAYSFLMIIVIGARRTRSCRGLRRVWRSRGRRQQTEIVNGEKQNSATLGLDFPTYMSWTRGKNVDAQLGDSFPKGIPGASQCAPSCTICITSGRAEGKDLAADGRDLGISFLPKSKPLIVLAGSYPYPRGRRLIRLESTLFTAQLSRIGSSANCQELEGFGISCAAAAAAGRSSTSSS